MSAYTDFVKANYHKVKHLPAKQRFAELAKMYKSGKGGVLSGAGLEEGGVKKGRKAKGGVMSGAGLDEHGAGFLSDALGAIGLGLSQKKLH